MEDYEKSIADEIQDELIKKVEELEKREIKFPDYTPQFEELRSVITEHNTEYPAKQIQSQLEELQAKISVIPKVIPVRHYLDLKSKGLLNAVAILLVSTAISVGIAIAMLIRNRELKAAADKFYMMRQSYPSIVTWADTTYLADPDKAMRKADSLEAAAADLAAAEREALETKQADDLARQKVKDLHGRKRHGERKKKNN
jgi:hypothetical protein